MSDFKVGDTIYHHFSTRAFATGIPTTLAGTPVAEAYEEASAVGLTAGVSLTIDHAETGHHLLTIVATGANSFETGKSYGVSLTTGTVDSVSVVGEVIFNFSLEKSPAAQDLANGTDGLGALKTLVDDVPTVAEFNARTLVAASYFDPAVDAVATVTTLTNLPAIPANWLTAAGIAATALNGKGDWNIGKTGYALSAAGVDAIWDELLAGHVTADSAGLVLNDWQNGGRLDLLLDAIPTTAMRGTDNALLAASAPTNFSDLSITVTTGLVNITQAAADKVWSSATRTLTAFSTALALSIWDVLETAILTASSIGLKVKNNLDAVLTARTLPSASYFDPAVDTVANVTTVATTTTNTDMRGTDSAALASVCTETRLSELDAGMVGKAANQIDEIRTDTENIQSRLPTALVSSRMDATVDATGMESGAVDTIWAKTMAELVAVPGVAGTVLAALEWLFQLARNKGTQTSTTKTLRNDADDGDIATSAISDDGTTFIRGEWS